MTSAQPPISSETVPEEYDLIILGSGEGSKYIAWTLAQQRQRVAVIERKYIGGSWPQHRLPPEQEHHPQRQSRFVFSEE